MAKFRLEDGTEVEAFTADELQAKIDSEVGGLKAKRDELLGLHAKDKERLAELEADQQRLADERAKEKGQFKELYEKTQGELLEERDNARKYRQAIQDKELEATANGLVTELTRDNKRAMLLKKEALQYVKHTDKGIVFEIGGVEVDASKLTEKLRTEYPFLVDGSGASGGGAQGANHNAKGGKKFNEFNPVELTQIKKEQPAEYERLRKEFYN